MIWALITGGTALKLSAQELIETSPPEPNSKAWYEANYSDDWKVEYNGKLKISKYKEQDTTKFFLREGFFIGRNGGEFGGELTFYPDGDITKKYKVMNGDIIGFYRIKGDIYVLEGLAHLGLSNGSIFKLERIGDKWTSEQIIDLNDAPYAFAMVKQDIIYLVTCRKLLKIEKERIEEVIVDNAFWEGLYPNSIIIMNNKAFIGMRGGIAKVDLKTKKISWLTNKQMRKKVY